jgi:radical SAM superfamily enzyme YgiQ (UPF0313 family)
MKVLLISPCRSQKASQQKSVIFPQLALDLLAGLTPPEHEVSIVEEEYEEIRLDADCELVGISCMTSNAPRAYELAKEFRERGKAVVLGGIHPTILPEEALRHADSVVVGEAEGVWPRLLDDFGHGRLQKTYHDPRPPLDKYVPVRPRRGLRKGIFHVVPVMTTRGCPYNCEFCCVHDVYGPRIRHVPVENVVRHIVDSRGRVFMFLDDNIFGDRRYAKELFVAIKPLRIKWAGQGGLSIARDPELLKLARASGCGALFFGLESISEDRLGKMGKSIPRLEEVGEALEALRRAGIYAFASVVFGFDEDTAATFSATVRFMEKHRVGSAAINVLTPYPATRTYSQLKGEGRIFTDDWRYYNHNTVVFRPKNLMVPELLAGRIWARRTFTRIPAMLRRLPANWRHPLLHLAINMASHRSSVIQARNFPGLVTELVRMETGAPEGETPARAYRYKEFAPK